MKQVFKIVGIVLAVSWCTSFARAADREIGQVVFVQGKATIKRADQEAVKAASFGDSIYQMDTLETQKGELKILFQDKTLLGLSQNSKVLVTEYVYKPESGVRRSIYDILKGVVRTVVEQSASLKTNDVKIQTPTAVAGIRGTDVGIRVKGRDTQFLCFEGKFEAFLKKSPDQKVVVTTGQFTQISGTPPTSPAPISQGLMKQFSGQLQPPPLKAVLSQAGGSDLSGKEAAGSEGPAADGPGPGTSSKKEGGEEEGGEEGQQGQEEEPAALSEDFAKDFEPPPPPEILPGGEEETPQEAADAQENPGDAGSGGEPVPEPVPVPGPTTGPVHVPVSFP